MTDKEFVIGSEIAAALQEEETRLARANIGPSRMNGVRYDVSNCSDGLIDPSWSPIDESICDLCRAYDAEDADAQSKTRQSISMEDAYTLMEFSKRSAVFGIRARDPQVIIAGLTAIAMVELNRVDYRDVLVSLGLLYFAFGEVEKDPDREFASIARIAESPTSELIIEFSRRPADSKTLPCWGFAVVETASGKGLMQCGGREYSPTVALDSVALQLGRLFQIANYSVSVEIGSELPATWLSDVDDVALSRVLKSVRAGAVVHCTPRRDKSENVFGQIMMAFLVETFDDTAAHTLHRLAKQKMARSNDFSMAAAMDQCLFCLLIARSFVADQIPIESPESIQRFVPEIEQILQACPQQSNKSGSTSMLTRIRNWLASGKA